MQWECKWECRTSIGLGDVDGDSHLLVDVRGCPVSRSSTGTCTKLSARVWDTYPRHISFWPQCSGVGWHWCSQKFRLDRADAILSRGRAFGDSRPSLQRPLAQ
jgi:hypothetical protein